MYLCIKSDAGASRERELEGRALAERFLFHPGHSSKKPMILLCLGTTAQLLNLNCMRVYIYSHVCTFDPKQFFTRDS
jgi:hypothetical protein